MMATEICVTIDEFRADFPEFADESVYTTSALYNLLQQATCYIHNVNYGTLQNKCRKLGIELMLAHLQALKNKIASGQNSTNQIGSTSIDSVSVSLVAPPNRNQFEYWLSLTPYGQQYLMLLEAHAPAGLYFGGSFQRVLR